jgi:hypothetical protein
MRHSVFQALVTLRDDSEGLDDLLQVVGGLPQVPTNTHDVWTNGEMVSNLELNALASVLKKVRIVLP